MPESCSREFFVVGVTHIDLAWKRGVAEMTEMLEIFVIRLLDTLDREPGFRYMIEQASHYRTLARTRPDLLERLKRYVQEGRVEMAGGMASTLETNLPNGESFVRNQSLGMKWVRDNFGVEIQSGWLFDTFGIHAQVPQILRQFGLAHLMANRFGGATFQDIFHAQGLDGSQVLVVGREFYSAFVRRENTARVFYKDWDGIERLFQEADELPGTGPFLLIPYLENESLLSLRPLRIAEERNVTRSNESYQLATPSEYFAALDSTTQQSGREWPVISADLNPEFTGCFSLRPTIRLRNRRVETLLLEAEKWATLQCLVGWQENIEEAWWQMAFVQFHDVFTGSHPTPIYQEVLRTLDTVEEIATQILNRALESIFLESSTTPKGVTVLAVNGLPWERTDLVRIPLVSRVTQVIGPDGIPLPFQQDERELRFLASLPSVGSTAFHIDTTSDAPDIIEPATSPPVAQVIIENEYLALEVNSAQGICRLVWKATGAVLMENVGDLLVAQRDEGTFQIESPNGAEVNAVAGEMQVFFEKPSPFGQSVRLAGTFPSLPWAGPKNSLTWDAQFLLVAGKPKLDLEIRLQWKGEGSRLRLKLPTKIDSSEGIFEVPFGTVRRKPYGIRANARGEWPAHRFVALEDGTYGMALANTGVGGVEVNGGTLWTTLLRAPKVEDVGMFPDDTSSQHGIHTFTFAIIPYAGTWSTSGVPALAQELNTPVGTVLRSGKGKSVPISSHLQFDSDHIILSAIKPADDGSGELIVRFYETAGRSGDLVLFVRDAVHAWSSNLREIKKEALFCRNNQVTLPMRPYEIQTIRVLRKS